MPVKVFVFKTAIRGFNPRKGRRPYPLQTTVYLENINAIALS
ncbi:MAG TPA: hypothetical protein VE130_17475 [Nitrososphaeraceae archaeon]|nr:hypothetical protein [Nitrososphaeraceae archaeon]